MLVQPFRGLAPDPSLASEVASVPYDVVNRAEAKALAEGKPFSLLRVDRAEIEQPDDSDPYHASVYDLAKTNLKMLQSEGALIREQAPCYYVYRQTMGHHVQTGVALTCRVQDYESGLVKKHEKTRPDKEADRTRLIDTISAQTGPVFLAHRAHAEVRKVLDEVTAGEPSVQFTAPDGVAHAVWRVSGPESAKVTDAFSEVEAFYIADGHHRAASAANVAKLRRTGVGDSAAPYEWMLAVVFAADQLKVLPYNRLVHEIPGRSPSEFLSALGEVFRVSPTTETMPTAPQSAIMYLDGQWHALAWDKPQNVDPASALDVSVIQDNILAPLLGIADPRTDQRIEFVGGIRGPEELKKRIDHGDGVVGFSMFPTKVEEVMAISDADQIMPPKSTWFEPKLRSGLFIHTFET
ncbi:MAG: DUF1015 domain-containing protein [Verrucomicrobiales bacterium]